VLYPGRLKVDEFYDFRKAYKEKHGEESKNFKELTFVYSRGKDFIKYWTYIWMSWGALYGIFFLDEFWKQNAPYGGSYYFHETYFDGEILKDSEKIHDFELIIDFCMRIANNVGTFFMILFANTLAPFNKSSNESDNDKRTTFYSKFKDFVFKHKVRVGILIIVLFDILFIFILTKMPSFDLMQVTGILSNAYGVIAATALAAIAGRLDSFYITSQTYWTIVLFIYAAIQASFPFYTLEGFEEIKITIAYTAFTLKVLFYVFIVKQFEDWRIYYYLSAYNDKNNWFLN